MTLILGILQVLAGFSLFAGGSYGHWFGIFAASISAIAALLSIPAYPFWLPAGFALEIIVIDLSASPAVPSLRVIQGMNDPQRGDSQSMRKRTHE
jgi:hypothetical protein